MGFWKRLGIALQQAAFEIERDQRRADRIRHEKDRQDRDEKARKSGRFIVRARATEQEQTILAAFDDIRENISRYGKTLSDNTPGDCMAVPLSANFNYRVASGLGGVKAILTPARPSSRFAAYEEDIRRQSTGSTSGAVTIEGKGVRVYSITDIWAKAVYLRFDKGNPENLLALHQKLQAFLPATAAKERPSI